MTDPTEYKRRALKEIIEDSVESDDEQAERLRLEEQYGQVWDTQEVQQDYEVLGFLAPFVSVRRRSDGVKGIMCFQHWPRFYFDFQEA